MRHSTSIRGSVCPLVAWLVSWLVGRSRHAQVENLEKKQKSLEMIQKYARIIPRCAIHLYRIGLIELGIGLMELGIGLRINNAWRTVLARVSGLVFYFSSS